MPAGDGFPINVLMAVRVPGFDERTNSIMASDTGKYPLDRMLGEVRASARPLSRRRSGAGVDGYTAPGRPGGARAGDLVGAGRHLELVRPSAEVERLVRFGHSLHHIRTN